MFGSEYISGTNGEILSLTLFQCNIVDLTPISALKKLEHLDISSNLVEDISPLSQLLNVRTLYLGGNKIKDLTPLQDLKLLETLAIWDNPIDDVTALGRLTTLKRLYCPRIGISDLNFIKELKNLIFLHAGFNSISDISIIPSLDMLEVAVLEENKISDVSPLINLERPISLALSHNAIKHIPSGVGMKYMHLLDESMSHGFHEAQESTLLLYENPLEFPPISVIQSGAETIKNYYETSDSFGHEPLSEGRVIVVGDGSAGKSSLIERVLYDTFEQGKTQTNGIKIDHWKLRHEDERELIFHIWDFGGQEIQHAVHKFFFSEGCLYILVLDNRKEEEPEYWLQQIESLGGSAPVLVVFNKQDDNATEIADRKFLKEKYPNIVGFYNTSCKTGAGIAEFKKSLEMQVVRLRTVDEQFPNNWFNIKKSLEECTSGSQHYLNYDNYREICRKYNAENETTQKLLLKYFTTIGAVTWFGDTFLNFLHVLSPAWITEGVYKIITSRKTSQLLGHINISDFKELLQPNNERDYTYEESHYGYILSMMKKFDLCYTPDDENLLLPSAFGKEPKLEYSEFRGEEVRTYILQFKDYMPIALIHRFIAKKISDAYDKNYWYSGIVIEDSKSSSLAMVQADKEAKRVYVRIKGDSKLGMWEHIRREFDDIASSYANINYSELVALDEKTDSTVDYEDLMSYIQAGKPVFFHPKLKRDFNVGYLMGLFERKEDTIDKLKKGELFDFQPLHEKGEHLINLAVNILNQNSSTVSNQNSNQISIDINIELVNNISTSIKGDSNYLLNELGTSNQALRDALQKVIQFADDAKAARSSDDIKEKGWGRRLKNIIATMSSASEQVKNIQDGGEVIKSIFHGLKDLASEFNLQDIQELINKY